MVMDSREKIECHSNGENVSYTSDLKEFEEERRTKCLVGEVNV
ncbi:MAG: hypothetical protein H6Q68_3588 [Firmicutes bacterium]|nr:hypothetical protein [Bacillota bacterium]